MRILRHTIAILVAPVTVTIVVPLLLTLTIGTLTLPLGPVGDPAAATLGVAALGGGLTLVIWTIFLFDRDGDGTLAPWDSPRRLVLRGPYRHVRNPMISGVLAILLAESLILRSPVLLAWFAAFFLLNQTYIPLWEEPDLEKRFGRDYVAYRQNVRRWVPRLHAWNP
ncbi:isoprenylcysteine carboxylmethyltransferase family protein [Saccharopolyspora taberi]|uniref:RemK protein n=1 Tax=Saccharopolyspora taberi TaxID=60895 RepID=A0ABN3VJX8_9PSEU